MDSTKIFLYSVYDKQLDYFYSPIPHYHDKDICKEMRMVSLDTSTIICQCPANFALYCIGEFDYTTGDIIPEKRLVIEFSALKAIMESEVADE